MAVRPALKRLVMSFCEKETARQVSFLRGRFQLDDDYNPDVYVTFMRGKPSEGGLQEDGTTFITISTFEVRDLVGTNGITDLQEYDHIEDDPDIGNCDANWKKYLACLIAHELAHTLTLAEVPHFRLQIAQYFPPEVNGDFEDQHGKLWQEVYRVLRREHVSLSAYYTRFVYPSTELSRSVIKMPSEERIIYTYDGQNVAFYIRNKDGIFLSNSEWSVRRRTTFKNLFDIRKHLTT